MMRLLRDTDFQQNGNVTFKYGAPKIYETLQGTWIDSNSIQLFNAWEVNRQEYFLRGAGNSL